MRLNAKKLKLPPKNYLVRYERIIEGYGFVFNPYYHLIAYVTMMLGLVFFTYYFELALFNMVILIVVISVLLPIFILLQYEYSYEERSFKEFTMFIQSLSSDFKGYPKAYAALQGSQKYCGDNLNQCVQEVLEQLEKGEEYDKALSLLDERYHFFVLHNLLVLMGAVEKYGANHYMEGIDLIQDDLDDCIEDMYLLQHQLINIRNRVYVLCAMSLFIGFLSKEMLSDLYVFSTSKTYQLSILIYALSVLLAIFLCTIALRNTWRLWEHYHE